MTTKHYSRPSAGYTGEAGLPNRTKYQDDSTASPKVPVSSAKVDGDINMLVDAVNELYDTAVTGVVADGSVTNAKISTRQPCSVMGRASNTSGAVADIQATTDDVVLVRKSNTVQFSTVPTGGIDDSAITTPKLANGNVTFAKVQSVNTSTLVGRYNSGTGPVESIMLGTGLSMVGSALTPSAASTTAAGIAQFADSAALNASTPLRAVSAEQLPEVVLQTVTLSGQGAVNFALPSGYTNFIVEVSGYRPSTASILALRFSTDGGSNYVSTNHDWLGYILISGSSSSEGGTTGYAPISSPNNTVSTTSSNQLNGRITIYNPFASLQKFFVAEAVSYLRAAGDAPVSMVQVATRHTDTSPITHIQVSPTAGNLAVGKLTLKGIR